MDWINNKSRLNPRSYDFAYKISVWNFIFNCNVVMDFMYYLRLKGSFHYFAFITTYGKKENFNKKLVILSANQKRNFNQAIIKGAPPCWGYEFSEVPYGISTLVILILLFPVTAMEIHVVLCQSYGIFTLFTNTLWKFHYPQSKTLWDFRILRSPIWKALFKYPIRKPTMCRPKS